MTTSDYQPQRFVTPPAAPTPPLVMFAAERRLRHAATLFIVIGYLWLIGSVLGFLLILASFSSVTP
jgi:hypothetical protein